MPLIVVVGLPSAGKTRRAVELYQFLAAKLGAKAGDGSIAAVTVTTDASDAKSPSPSSSSSSPSSSSHPDLHLINHESLHISRAQMFADPTSEKKGMGAFRSTVERLLNRNRIVILDFMNHIKGFRYELFTRSKAMGTQHCVYWVKATQEQCKKWNEKKRAVMNSNSSTSSVDTADEGKSSLSVDRECYSDQLIVDLMGRMEEPNEAKRWDQPLFTVEQVDEDESSATDGTTDADGSTRPKSTAPLEDIAQFIFHGKQLTQGLATLSLKSEDSTYLFQLDQITSGITQSLLRVQSQGFHTQGEWVTLSNETQEKFLLVKVTFHLPELRRLQQQFIKMAKMRPPQGAKAIATAFIQFLNESLKNE